ncbi:YifB family Mg chelatase-like AAA ATPase [Lachnoclostridium sp. Marseille-P6806]|uniref:YifB family Mg chelatase-like AAA ATPase n=1 Tax=Lachnoclostridium sp. Marseille-P6806 TaxID=2364793 RepID=UPI0010301FE9|nr:YifB family Mg chelatase-like AAA ATPase [Lachnoclostridium sp. Marseille-P6806]
MFSRVVTGAVFGIVSYCMCVETDISKGLPVFSMVGFLSNEMKEAGDRVRVALRNAGVELPPSRIVINFSPADIPKRGMVVDLPVAAGILAALGVVRQSDMEGLLIAGELGLDGEVKPIRGVLPIVRSARERGIRTCLLPVKNAAEGAVFSDMRIIPLSSLRQMIRYLLEPAEGRDALIPPFHMKSGAAAPAGGEAGGNDFSVIHGQAAAKRVLEIAAAGFHNTLLIGAPGSGKSMLARCMPGIMPPLTQEESMEVSAIYSIAGRLPPEQPLMTRRPYLSPHHTITRAALTGGGAVPVPGAITLANRGVLFLDELPEFGREKLDLLRQPLEDHQIPLSRRCGSFVYPARFLMLGAMNPCPCGSYPDRSRCRCTEPEIRRYLGRISGPFLDRMDLCSETSRMGAEELIGAGAEENSETVLGRVMEAAERQARRFRGTEFVFNADMDARAVERYCMLGDAERRLMRRMFDRLGLTARGYHRMLRTARTIADLAGEERIKEIHLMEAAGYRAADRRYWGKEGEEAQL